MKSSTARITSIDALRAVALLGILIVHASELFGFFNPRNSFDHYLPSDWSLVENINLLFSGRCSAIFSILFGVSFYLILRKPSYSGLKFVWRCVLLIMIGLLVKFFYSYEILIWYGLWGAVLVLFRRLKPSFLFISFCVTHLLAVYLIRFSLGDLLFAPSDMSLNRYVSTDSLADIIGYPLYAAVVDHVRWVLNEGVLKALSYFLLGYFFAKVGVIENLRKYSRLPYVLMFLVLYVGFFIAYQRVGGDACCYARNLFGAIFYAILFISFYYTFNRYISFSWLEAYGKLGLTNYCMQNICGVILASTLFLPFKFRVTTVLCCAIIFYLIQLIFSVVWLRYYKLGPLEWCWRVLTNLKYIPNRRREENC